jgi:hypothetical protein
VSYKVNLFTCGVALGKAIQQKRGSFIAVKCEWQKNIIMMEEINKRILKMILKVYNIEVVVIA